MPDRKQYTVTLSRVSEDRANARFSCRFRPGLLFYTVQSFQDSGLSVHSADYRIDSGHAIGSFVFGKSDGSKLSDEEAASLQNRLADALSPYTPDKNKKPDLSRTVILDISGTDRPGLLNDITAAISASGLEVDSAKIFTHKGRVMDTFFVTDHGKKVKDEERLSKLKETLFEVLKGDVDAQVSISAEGGVHALVAKRETIFKLHDEDSVLRHCPEDINSSERWSHEFQFAEQEAGKVTVAFDEVSSPDLLVCKIHTESNTQHLLYDVVELVADLGCQVHALKVHEKDGKAISIELGITDCNAEKITDILTRNRLRRLIISTVVDPSNDSHKYSTIRVQAPNRPHILRDVTEALKSLNVQVIQAVVDTSSDRGANIFYVQGTDGHPIHDPAFLQVVERRILEACEGAGTSAQ